MSGVYAYCVLPGGTPAPVGVPGITAPCVRACEVDGLAVWVSDEPVRPEPDLATIRRHHGVVGAALDHTVVPLRFGSWSSGPELLEARIREMHEALLETLRLVEGRFELGVRVQSTRGESAGTTVDDEPATSESSTGSAYLRALSRRTRARSQWRQLQDEAARRVREALAGVVHGERVRYLPPPELVTLAHLVRRQDEGEYRTRVGSLATEGRGERLVHVTGPWPPYSFAVP